MQNTIDSNTDLYNNFDFKVKLSIIYIVLIYGIVIILCHKDSIRPKYAVKICLIYIFFLKIPLLWDCLSMKKYFEYVSRSAFALTD